MSQSIQTLVQPTTSQYIRGSLYGVAAVGIWASWIVAVRLGIRTSLTPWDIVAIRFGVAGLVLLPYLLKKGLADQAILVFKDLVNRMPADSTYHYHLAMAYDKKGDSKGASDQLREAMKHNPSKDELQRIREMLGKSGS